MCWSERKKPALIVTILSVVVILCGIAMVVESIMYTNSDFIKSSNNFGAGIQSF